MPLLGPDSLCWCLPSSSVSWQGGGRAFSSLAVKERVAGPGTLLWWDPPCWCPLVSGYLSRSVESQARLKSKALPGLGACCDGLSFACAQLQGDSVSEGQPWTRWGVESFLRLAEGQMDDRRLGALEASRKESCYSSPVSPSLQIFSFLKDCIYLFLYTCMREREGERACTGA